MQARVGFLLNVSNGELPVNSLGALYSGVFVLMKDVWFSTCIF